MTDGSSNTAHKLIAWLGVLVATGGLADFIRSTLANLGVNGKIIDSVVIAIGAGTTIAKMWRDSKHDQAIAVAAAGSATAVGSPVLQVPDAAPAPPPVDGPGLG